MATYHGILVSFRRRRGLGTRTTFAAGPFLLFLFLFLFFFFFPFLLFLPLFLPVLLPEEGKVLHDG